MLIHCVIQLTAMTTTIMKKWQESVMKRTRPNENRNRKKIIPISVRNGSSFRSGIKKIVKNQCMGETYPYVVSIITAEALVFLPHLRIVIKVNGKTLALQSNIGSWKFPLCP